MIGTGVRNGREERQLESVSPEMARRDPNARNDVARDRPRGWTYIH
jgi:hypothetical protein